MCVGMYSNSKPVYCMKTTTYTYLISAHLWRINFYKDLIWESAETFLTQEEDDYIYKLLLNLFLERWKEPKKWCAK